MEAVNLDQKVREYVRKYDMIENGDMIVIGLSGGADSVCLFLLLCEMARERSLRLAAVHVNHKIRKEAPLDAEFVSRLCGREKIPFYLVEEDVERLAAKERLSEEEAGRKVRYEAFTKVLDKLGGGKIAVAHNQNDRAETMLFNMFRGTGLPGMAGIRPVRENIIRPLLCVQRAEIEAWLEERGEVWRLDQTNESDAYTRNRIRHRILPEAEKSVCCQASKHLAAEAELLMEADGFIRKMTLAGLERCCVNEDTDTLAGIEICGRVKQRRTAGTGKERGAVKRIALRVTDLLEEDAFIQKCIIKECLSYLSGGGKDITARHVEEVHSLFWGQGGRRAVLPYRIEAVRDFDKVVLRYRVDSVERSRPKELTVFDMEGKERFAGEELFVPGLGTVRFAVSRDFSHTIEQKTYTKWFDYDKIKTLVFRTRNPGDYLTINDKFQRKSIKDYMIQEKIPSDVRDGIYLLADGSSVIWVPGYRISSTYKVTEHTKRILQVERI